MCDPTTALLVGGTTLGLYGNKRSADSAQNAQFQQFQFDQNRRNDEFRSEHGRLQDVFSADQVRASEVSDLQARERQALSQRLEQEGVIGQERLAAIREAIQAEENEFQGQQNAQDVALTPVAEIADAAANNAAISDAQDDLVDVVEESAASGNQDVGVSGAFGRVSEDFNQGADSAKESNISRAKQRARRLGTGVGIGNLQQDNADSIADAGFNANLSRAKVGRDKRIADQVNNLTQANLSAREGSLSRQEQLDRLLFDIDRSGIESRFGLAGDRAAFDNALRPEDIVYIDPNNRRAQLYTALGNLATGVANSGFSFGAGGSAGNTAVNATPSFTNRFAGYV